MRITPVPSGLDLNLVLKIQGCWMKGFTLRCFFACSPRVHSVTWSIDNLHTPVGAQGPKLLPTGTGPHVPNSHSRLCRAWAPSICLPTPSPGRLGPDPARVPSPRYTPSLGDRAEKGNCLLGELPQSVVRDDPAPPVLPGH